MSIDDFMVKKKSLLVIDMYNLVFRNLHMAHPKDPTDTKFLLFKDYALRELLRLLKQFSPDRCVIAIDDRKYWRKDIYHEYKAHRKVARAKSKINFDVFFPVLEEFLSDLKEVFPNMIHIKVDNCEADDTIAILTEHRWSGYRVTNVSNDSDLMQLMKFEHYQQYDPIKKQTFRHINFERNLIVKILTGDTSDNISGVKPRCGPVTAHKMIKEGLETIFKEEPEIEAKYIRNKELIDLSMIPVEIKTKILEKYDNININKYNGSKVFKFLLNNRLLGIIEELEKYSKELNGLS